MAPESNESVLRKTQLFARLNENEMRTLCARVSRKHFGRGETLFSEGDRAMGCLSWPQAEFGFCLRLVANRC